jgi:Tfp pilus assembly protein PilO
VAAYEELKATDNKELDGLRAQIDKLTQDHSEVLKLKKQFDELKRKIDRIDLLDLQTFPSDHSIHNLLADYGIEYKSEGPGEVYPNSRSKAA